MGAGSRAEAVSSSMVQLFDRVRSAFRPSQKRHYVFTPRDLTRWTLSLLRMPLPGKWFFHSTNSLDSDALIRAVAYEADRVFRDRLASPADRSNFDDMVAEIFPRRGNLDILFVPAQLPIPPLGTGLTVAPVPKSDYASILQKAITRYEFEVALFPHVLTDELVEVCAKLDESLTGI